METPTLSQKILNVSFRPLRGPLFLAVLFALTSSPLLASTNELVFQPEGYWTGFRLFFVPFLGEGVKHILTGFDHLLFIAGLHVLATRFSQMFKIATAFTVAHSLTLALSALSIVSLPTALTEALIALTIVWVALENGAMLLVEARPDSPISEKLIRITGTMENRWKIAFAFGLIHGFGFSTLLRHLMPRESIVAPLLGFNLGVEAGQLALVALAFPLILWLGKKSWYRWFALVVSILVGMAGAFWFTVRVFY